MNLQADHVYLLHYYSPDFFVNAYIQVLSILLVDSNYDL